MCVLCEIDELVCGVVIDVVFVYDDFGFVCGVWIVEVDCDEVLLC